MPSNGARNACWYFLTRSLRMEVTTPSSATVPRNTLLAFPNIAIRIEHPSNNTRECQLIGLNVYRYYPQAHGSIVVAFHPEVLSGYRYLYFSQRKAS